MRDDAELPVLPPRLQRLADELDELDELDEEGLPVLRFAVHELGTRRIGAILIWRPTTQDVAVRRHEPLVHNTPRLRLDSVGEEADLAHARAQTDGDASLKRSASASTPRTARSGRSARCAGCATPRRFVLARRSAGDGDRRAPVGPGHADAPGTGGHLRRPLGRADRLSRRTPVETGHAPPSGFPR